MGNENEMQTQTKAEGEVTLEEVLEHPPSSLWRDALRHLFHKRSAILGMVILGVILLIAMLHPLLATHDPNTVAAGGEYSASGGGFREINVRGLFGLRSGGTMIGHGRGGAGLSGRSGTHQGDDR